MHKNPFVTLDKLNVKIHATWETYSITHMDRTNTLMTSRPMKKAIQDESILFNKFSPLCTMIFLFN